MNTSVQNVDKRLTRINNLKRELNPTILNLENLQENIARLLELSNEKLNNHIKENCAGLEEDTKVNVSINDTYTRILIENKVRSGWNHSFELTIELHGFNKFSLLDSKPKKFNPEEIQYSINSSSGTCSLENLQDIDRTILHAFLCTEMKKFGNDNQAESFFSILTSIMSRYFEYLGSEYKIKSDTYYPIKREIEKIENEIKAEKKSLADAITLSEISKSIGVKLEFNEETISENDRYTYGRNLKDLFNISWMVSYITILKVSTKTVTIQLGSSIYETKRIKKEDMIKAFPKLKVLVEENA